MGKTSKVNDVNEPRAKGQTGVTSKVASVRYSFGRIGASGINW